MEVDGVTESVDDYLSQHHPRIVGTVQSKRDLLRTVDRESGDEVDLSEFQPHIWTKEGSCLEDIHTAIDFFLF